MSNKVKFSSLQKVTAAEISDDDVIPLLSTKDGTDYTNVISTVKKFRMAIGAGGEIVSASIAQTASIAENVYISASGQNVTLGNVNAGIISASFLYATLVTQSLSTISGSSNFGELLTDRHTFTGSLNITGSVTVNEVDVNDTFTTLINQGSVLSASLDNYVLNSQTSSLYVATASLASTASYFDYNNLDNIPTPTSTASLVANDSDVSGSSVKDALNTLSSSFANNIETTDTIVTASLTGPFWSGTSTLTSALLTLSSSLETLKSNQGNLLYVNNSSPTATDDRTGLNKSDILNPFNTISSSLVNASSGDLIVVAPGTYDEELNMADGVNLHLENGVIITSTTGTTFTSVTGSSFSISGLGVMKVDNAAAGSKLFDLGGGNATISVRGKKIVCNNTNGSNTKGIKILEGHENLRIDFNLIEESSNSGGGDFIFAKRGIFKFNGDVHHTGTDALFVINSEDANTKCELHVNGDIRSSSTDTIFETNNYFLNATTYPRLIHRGNIVSSGTVQNLNQRCVFESYDGVYNFNNIGNIFTFGINTADAKFYNTTIKNSLGSIVSFDSSQQFFTSSIIFNNCRLETQNELKSVVEIGSTITQKDIRFEYCSFESGDSGSYAISGSTNYDLYLNHCKSNKTILTDNLTNLTYPSYNTPNDDQGSTRPTTPSTGSVFFDTTVGAPIWYNGNNWVNATGSIV
jgi:hypothetical protein